MYQAQRKKSLEFYDPTFGNGGVLELPFDGVVGRVPDSVLPLPDSYPSP